MNSKQALFYLLAACVILLPGAAFPGTFVASGPDSYTRGTGSPVAVTKNFSVLNPSTTYTLQIYNGGLTDGEFEKVSSSTINRCKSTCHSVVIGVVSTYAKESNKEDTG